MTARRVEFSQDAAAEAEDAYAWLLERSPAAASSLLHALRVARDQLSRFPRSGPVWLGAGPDVVVRRLALPDTRYSLFYRDTGEVIEVLAVAHSSRKPGYWLTR